MRGGASVPCSTRLRENFFFFLDGWKAFFKVVYLNFFVNFNFHQSILFRTKQSFFRNIDVIYRPSG